MEQGPRLTAGGDEVVSGNQARRANGLFRQSFQRSYHEVVIVQVAMARKAIEPVELEVFLEALQPQESLQRAGLHVRHVFKAQMVMHQRFDLLSITPRESQARADL